MPRVLMLLSNRYRPDVRVEKEARALIEAGHEVTVAAWDRERDRPGEEGGAPKVRRVRTGRVRNMPALLLNYPRFALGLLRAAREEGPEVVHAHDLDTLLPGILISRLRGVPLVYDAHEHYAKMVEVDIPAFISPLIDRLEFAMLGAVDLLVVANRRIAQYLSPHHRGETVEVMNCVDLPPPSGGRGEGPPVLLYGGTLEPKRLVEEVIEAVEGTEGCLLRVAGRGRLAPMVREAAERCSRIEFLGYLPHDVLMEEMAAADGILCLLDPSNENNVIGTPNRMFEAMAVGVPPIVTEGTLSGEMVEEEGCGIAMGFSMNAFKGLLERLADREAVARMGVNGRRAAEERYNWGIMGRRLVEAYDLLSSERM